MSTQAPVTGLVPGTTGKFVAVVYEANGAVITDTAVLSQLSYAWSSSDQTDEPVVASGTAGDDSVSITVPATAAANQGATLGVVVTGDSVSLTGSVQVPVLAPPAPVPSSVVIVQQS